MKHDGPAPRLMIHVRLCQSTANQGSSQHPVAGLVAPVRTRQQRLRTVDQPDEPGSALIPVAVGHKPDEVPAPGGERIAVPDQSRPDGSDSTHPVRQISAHFRDSGKVMRDACADRGLRGLVRSDQLACRPERLQLLWVRSRSGKSDLVRSSRGRVPAHKGRGIVEDV